MRSAEEIIEKLKGSFNAPRTKDEKIKLVVCCILVSTTFWFFSALNKSNYVTRINYPIVFDFDTEKYVAVKPLPKHISLEVTGGGWDLMTRSFGFGMAPIVISLDDPAKSNFKLSATLRGELSPMLEPVTVNYVLNDSIFYHIEPVISRDVPLSFDSAGIQLAPNYRLTSAISLSPPRVTFTGPESLVNALPSPYTVPASGDAHDDPVEEKFDLPDSGSELVRPNISEVKVGFEVEEFVPHRKTIKLMLLNFNDPKLALNPNEAEVTYTIRKSEEVHADSLGITLIADFQSFNRQDSSVTVSVATKAAYIHDLVLLTDKVKVISNE